MGQIAGKLGLQTLSMDSKREVSKVRSPKKILSYLTKESEFDAVKQVKDGQKIMRDVDDTFPKI